MAIKKILTKSFFFNQGLFLLWILAITLSWTSIHSSYTMYCDCSKSSELIQLIISNLIFYLIPLSLECKKRKWIIFKKRYFVYLLSIILFGYITFIGFQQPKPSLSHSDNLNYVEEMVYLAKLKIHYEPQTALALFVNAWYKQQPWLADKIVVISQNKMPEPQLMSYIIFYGTSLPFTDEMTRYLNQINTQSLDNQKIFNTQHCFYHLFYIDNEYYSSILNNKPVFNALTSRFIQSGTHLSCDMDMRLLGLPPSE